ncbi:ribonuclease HII [Spiroplasma tabanidicola]|uniref:Ribonuclease n=1 Tax=Spiroplasma tabanidicola TaxID=324079 RepID=A0A6I6C8H7_9MOLU|nr:ribonuclease HII [Spiroplasma tabanidicola]QGS51749.1 ribonuclease HII [Spiroplasma tabanidicola]
MIKINRYKFDLDIKEKYQVTIISGSDEVGRGAMAGPIVVASIILKEDYFNPLIKDSKLLNQKQREILYEEILNNCVEYSIKVYDSKVVDKLNPKKTSVVGMIETISELKTKPQLCLVDGEKITIKDYQTLQLIKGDNLSQSIAAASILAKVYRDNIMIEYDKQYQGYNFFKHKGYCTKEHIQKVKELGILEIHRLTYKPISAIKEKNNDFWQV